MECKAKSKSPKGCQVPRRLSNARQAVKGGLQRAKNKLQGAQKYLYKASSRQASGNLHTSLWEILKDLQGASMGPTRCLKAA